VVSPQPNLTTEFFTEKHCSTSDEFIAALSPRRSEYKSTMPRGWIFRGQADNSHPLTPTALRSESKALLTSPDRQITTNKEQIFFERQVLKDFLKIADSIGLNLPEDTQTLRSWLNLSPAHIKTWPISQVLSLMGLAQHHGLPTRLLDWSRHPLKAAWFAAAEAAQSEDKSGLLCVWALSLELLELIDEGPKPFTVVTTPTASNSNLRAQEGLFTLGKGINADNEPVNRLPFDQLLKEEFQRCELKAAGVWFHRVTLPRAEAEQLEFDLALEGITRAALFPDFSGVVGTLRDRDRWMRKGGPGYSRLEANLGAFAVSYKRVLPLRYPKPDPTIKAEATGDSADAS
jgi:hypothetical protein